MDIERNNDASPINILIHFKEFIQKHVNFQDITLTGLSNTCLIMSYQ